MTAPTQGCGPIGGALLLLLHVVFAGGAGGQSSAARPRSGERGGSVVLGSVLAVDSAGALVGAEVLLEEAGLRARTDDAGNYVVRDVPPGTHSVLVRHWGFAASRSRVVVSGTDTAAHVVLLERVALPGVTVRAAAPADPKRADLESRMQRAAMYGHLVDRTVLDRVPGRRLSAVVTRAAGVRVAMVRGRFVAASTRGSMGIAAKSECWMAVYVDGVRVYPAGKSPPVSLDDYVTDDVEAIEIYSGPARVPLEYRGTGSGACGVIAIWRRNG